MKRGKGRKWHGLHWVTVLHTGLRPLGYNSQPSPPLPSRRQSQQGSLAACPLGWVLKARRHALPPHLAQEHSPRGPWTRARACTHLPGSPQLESRERIQGAVHPPPPGEEGRSRPWWQIPEEGQGGRYRPEKPGQLHPSPGGYS